MDLQRAKPELYAALESHDDRQLLSLVADELHSITGATSKFIRFTLARLPEPPSERPGERFRVAWSKTKMKNHLGLVYKWRSRALHAGVPIPGPMCEPLVVPDETGIPSETIGSWWYGDHYWDEKDMPMTSRSSYTSSAALYGSGGRLCLSKRPSHAHHRQAKASHSPFQS